MAQIKAGVANATAYFNLDGLDYGKNQYQVVYSDVIQTAPGVYDEAVIKIGLYDKYK